MTWFLLIVGVVAAAIAFHVSRIVTVGVICKRSTARYSELCDSLKQKSAKTQNQNEALHEKLPFSLLRSSDDECESISKRVVQIQSDIDALQHKTSAHPKAAVERMRYRAHELQDLCNDAVNLMRSHVEIQSKLARAMQELEWREWELSSEGIRDRLDTLNEIAEKSSHFRNLKDTAKLAAVVLRARKNIGSWSNMQLDALLKEAEDMIKADGPLKWYIPFGSHLFDELRNRNAPSPVLVR